MNDNTFDFEKRRAVAGSMLDAAGCRWEAKDDGTLRTVCPGASLHSSGGEKMNVVVFLDGAPTLRCFHNSCSGVVAGFNAELRREVWRAEHDAASPVSQRPRRVLPPVPKGEVERPAPARDFDDAQAVKFADQWSGPVPDREWLRRRSPIDPKGMSAGDFLDALYEPGDRVMVLTWYRSTGDFMWVCGGDGRAGRAFRLGKEPGVKAVPAERLPKAGRGGVHFLVNPVSGEWRKKRVVSEGGLPVGRKLPECVSRWRYCLLESDVLPAEVWLRVVCQLELRVAALIRTGGKSVHALVRIPEDAPSHAEWRLWRDTLRDRLWRLGVDPQAMMETNSSRLPGCIRIPEGHEGPLAGLPVQELLYCDPAPVCGAISWKSEVRV
jgi:hypothetical protein